MTNQEFSIEFDILYNNLASNTAPPINEYEKSVLLTKAQSDIVIELYSGRNNLGLSYESSEEVKVYLKAIQSQATSVVDITNDEVNPHENIWLITREEISNMGILDSIPVIPVSQDEYSKIRNNPFRRVTNRRALRVNHGNSDRLIYPKIIDTTKPITYRVWGLIKPTPIILEGIDDPTLTIEGCDASSSKECELDSSLHRMILDRAVLYAKQAYIGGQVQE